MAELTQEERCRYARSIAIDSIGIEGQRKLKESKVMVVGCGALGTVAATYLCASGVGHLAIADFDTIDISNLQRQIMFMDSDAGKPKCHTLASRLRMLNPTVRIEEIPQMIKEEDAERLFPEFDFIIDGSDNPATKTMTSEVCKRLSKPCCIGGVSEMRGQVLTCTRFGVLACTFRRNQGFGLPPVCRFRCARACTWNNRFNTGHRSHKIHYRRRKPS